MKTKNFVIFGLVMLVGMLAGSGYVVAETEDDVFKSLLTHKVTIFNRTHGDMIVYWGDEMISRKKDKVQSPVKQGNVFTLENYSKGIKSITLNVQICDSSGLVIGSGKEKFFSQDVVNWVFFEEEDGTILNVFNYIEQELSEKGDEK